jgi:hypothetical protein
VAASGVSYFTAAGNYGNKSYASAFHPVLPRQVFMVLPTTLAAEIFIRIFHFLQELIHSASMG